MNTIIRALGTLIALGLAGSTLLAEPAPASHSDQATPISAELAKTCRALAVKAHPTQPAGSRTASGEAQRRYFQECVAKRRNMKNAIPNKAQLRYFAGKLARPVSPTLEATASRYRS